MPSTLDSLPPPTVELRRETDEERKNRLERAGVLESSSMPELSTRAGRANVGGDDGIVERLKRQGKSHSQISRESYFLWWTSDLAWWRALKSPTGTRTLADGAFSLGAELTHPEWTLSAFRLSVGPKIFFYNGAQYARLSDSIFTGNGFAQFNASELGMSATLVDIAQNSTEAFRGFWDIGMSYTPVRWVKAQKTSSAATIQRSDTYSKTALNLPGVGLQIGFGFDWNSMLRVEAFSGVHGAWPPQLRLRTGLQFSMGIPVLSTPSSKIEAIDASRPSADRDESARDKANAKSHSPAR